MKNIMNHYLFLPLLWCSPCIIFLTIYNFNFHSERNASIIHFLLILLSSISFLSLVRIINTFMKKSYILVNFILSFSWFILLYLMYFTMLTGLFSWGRIPTYKIILLYISQFSETIKTIGIPFWILLITSIFSILLITTLSIFSAFLLSKNRKNSCYLNKKKVTLYGSLFFLLAVVGVYRIWFYNIILYNEIKEPFYQFIGLNKIDQLSENVLLGVIGKAADERLFKKEEITRKNYLADVKKKPKSVILITVDALRPDRMGIYGYKRQTTPFLQKLKEAGQAHIVNEARSACPESTCGLLSLLSGKQANQLLPNNFSLPEILGLFGYKRYFILSGDHSNYYGLKESYGKNEFYWDGTHTSKYYVNDDWGVLEEVSNLSPASSENNYFFFIHLMSAHGIGKKHNLFNKWIPSQSIYNLSVDLDKDIDSFYNYYDNGVLQADFVINNIYNLLKNKQYIDNSSVVLITADHGESLGEHGIRTHATSLHEAEIRIPWIWLGRPLGNLDDPVIQADFAPTVLADMGAAIPEHWQGLPLQYGTQKREYSFHAQVPFAAVVHYYKEGRVKLIFNYRNKKKQFFDLKKDPKELHPKNSTNHNLQKALDKSGLSYLGNIK